MAMIFITLFIFAIALAAGGATRRMSLVVGTMAVAGYSVVTCVALCNTSIQRRIRDDMRGRVLSMYTFAFNGFLPFGNLFGGTLAEHRGIAVTFRLLGGCLTLFGLGAVVAFVRARRATAAELA